MAFLGKYRKDCLVQVAKELGESVSTENTVVSLKQIILDSPHYDEEFVKGLANNCQDSIEREKEREREREQREREEREREREREREERERAFELEKLRLTRQTTTSSEAGTEANSKAHIKLYHVMDKFRGEKDDITAYLSVFEAQANQLGVPEEDWVINLMGLLPNQVNSWLMIEGRGNATEYAEMKAQLLEMYKFNAEKFRQLFTKHMKQAGTTWNVYARELHNYCKQWVAGLQISTFEALLDLIVTDQMKRRVPSEIREHFIDEWGTFTVALEFAKKLDNYENNRAGWKSLFPRSSKKVEPVAEIAASSEKHSAKPYEKKGEVRIDFDQQSKRKCFACGSTQHLKRDCPGTRSGEKVALVADPEARELFRKHTVSGLINGLEAEILRDTGASFDIVNERLVKDEHMTGESVWIFQPLDSEPRNLPVAQVKVQGPFGSVVTKAAVVRKECDIGYYLLSNRTALLLDEIRKGYVEPQLVGAVVTRAGAARAEAREEVAPESPSGERPEETLPDETDETEGLESEYGVEDDHTELEPQVIDLIRVDRETFAAEQQRDSKLKEIYEAYANRVPEKGKDAYFIKNKLLFRSRHSKRGEKFDMIVVPEIYRGTILKLCHETANAHLGTTKSKDSMAKYFY